MILAALACPVFTSCYDDSALNSRLDEVENDIADLDQRLKDLETRLNGELKALQTLLEGKIATLQGKVDELITVSSCNAKNDGSYEITLSDGSKFTVYPEYQPDQTGLVTTTEIDGVLYWAIYEDGKPVVVTDAEGQPVPVVNVTPIVDVDPATGQIFITFDGGEEWISLGYDMPCVFAGAEVVYTDNYTDEEEAQGWGEEVPMYVTITLADGTTITVTVDGAASFRFASNYGGLISTQFVNPGKTSTIPVAATNITDWVKEVPAGWVIKENTQYLAEYGQAEFYVTAPSAEAIASGAAVAEGTLKVLAVAEGGKTVTASVTLTTKAFKTIQAGKGKLTVEMNSGVMGYLVGVSPVADFDADAILDELRPEVEYVPDPNDWMDFGWSPWYVDETATPLDDNYFDGSIEEYSIESLKTAVEFVEGEQYVIWVIALDQWTDETTWSSGWTLGSMYTVNYLNAFVNLETTLLAFNDIQISAEFKGITMFYGGFSEKYSDGDNRADIVSEINNYGMYYSPIEVNSEFVDGWDNGLYVGDPNTLVEGYQTIQPGTTYYLYILPYVEGKSKYTVSDLYYYEWTTDPLMAGGSTEVTVAATTPDYKKVSVELAAEDAVYIYYYFVDPAMVSTIADKHDYLLNNGYMSAGATATANKTGLNPGQTTTLLAMAVDQYGCYGDVLVQEFTTKEMEYAAATVTAELQGTPSTTGIVKFSCDAEVDTYYYWYKAAEHFTWGDSYYGTTVETASAYIALTPNSYYMNKVAAADLPAEGVEMTGLTVGSPCNLVVAAKLTDGTYTKATRLTFTPEMNLGNFVYATDDNGNENAAWVAAKPTVNANVQTIGDFTTVEWTVELPAGYTAITACFHQDYLIDYPSAKSKVQYILTSEYIGSAEVVAGETYVNNYASPGYNIYTVVMDAEGNYYETYVTELNISGGFGA